MALQLCHPYVWEDPRFIFKAFANDGICMSELVNRIVLLYSIFILLGLLIGSATNMSGMPLIFGIIASLFLIPTFIKMSRLQKSEGFEDAEEHADNFVPEGSQLENITKTTANARNPFQNIMVDDYKYAPTRAAAPNITNPEAKMALDAMFRTQWYSDPTDVYGKTQSQRMFLTQPSSTVPNGQKSYQEWLYKIPGKTCKEGNYDACLGGTGGAVIPWLDSV